MGVGGGHVLTRVLGGVAGEPRWCAEEDKKSVLQTGRQTHGVTLYV